LCLRFFPRCDAIADPTCPQVVRALSLQPLVRLVLLVLFLSLALTALLFLFASPPTRSLVLGAALGPLSKGAAQAQLGWRRVRRAVDPNGRIASSITSVLSAVRVDNQRR